ncbi:choice-of-anchor Q domain-containing protein [Bacteroidota bacterium]
MKTASQFLKWLSTLLFLSLISISAWSQTRVSVSGNISTDTEWSTDTIDVTSDVIIEDGATLTIDPGVLVYFQGYFGITIEGRLLAEGESTAGDTIRFESADSNGWHNFGSTAGGWKGIVINGGGDMDDNDTTVLSYCRIRFGKAASTGRTSGGGFCCKFFDKVAIENCVFENNYCEQQGGAVYFMWASGRVSNSTFLNNHADHGGGLSSYGSSTKITGSLFADNYAGSQGGAIYNTRGYAHIHNNEIRDNATGHSAGAICVTSDGGADIISNEIYRNEVEKFGGALYITSPDIRIAHNLVYENAVKPSDGYTNGTGGAIYISSRAVARLDSNQIYDNVNESSSGGAIWSDADTNIFIGNEIYNNTTAGGGGGIFVNSQYNKNSIFRYNKIYGNSVTKSGGGISIAGESAELTGNEIYENTGATKGGGINFYGSNVIVKNCLIANNTASVQGGGINNDNTDGEYINNIIVNNESPTGGGLYMKTANLSFVNNTICMNKATTASFGGAIRIADQCIPRFHNDIIYGNEDDTDADQVYLSQPDPVAYFSNCNIEGGVDNFTLFSGSLLGEKVGLIDADPDFISASTSAGNAGNGIGANWRVSSVSACINKGTTEIIGSDLPEKDYFDNTRISYSLPDIGAHEFNQSVIPASGTISQDITWTADTVKITAKVHVEDNVILTINPGVYVKFMGDYELQVDGALKAIGTETDSIIFSINDPTGFSNPGIPDGGWSGIYFSVPTGVSEIAYSRIEYVKERTSNNGAVYVAYGSGTNIRNSTFKNNMALAGGAAINVSGTAINITDCFFSNNVTTRTTIPTGSGSAIYLSSSNSTIERCVFENNNASGKGTIYMTTSHPVIRDNLFRNNHVAENGGALFVFAYSNPEISGNTMINNTADGKGGAIYTYNKCGLTISLNHIANNQALHGGGIYADEIKNTARITGNIIANNSASLDGGGIYLDDCEPEISNNTLANNASGSSGGGLYSTLSVPVINNTLVWGNEDSHGYNAFHILDGDGATIRFSGIHGGSGVITGGSAITYEDNLDTIPDFTDPSGGTGTGYPSTAEGWQLLSTSALINAGNKDIEGLELTDIDLLGNPRINNGQVDIGALENQAGLPGITLQPGSKIRCSGESAVFRVECSDSVYYQWTKDGIDLPGEENAMLEFDSVKLSDQASYQCILSNTYGSIQSSPVLLQVKEPPTILVGPEDTWAMSNSPVTLELYSRGSDLNFQWQKNKADIPGAIIPKLTILNTSSTDEGKYSCIISNSCGTDTTDEVSLYLAPQLCMITVDSATGNNLVIWEKQSSGPILSYNVYRESTAAGIYDLIANVPYDDLSVVEDTIANPAVQAYLYKITAVDTDGDESDINLCRAHKTIHLLVSMNPELNAPQLEWDRYYGFLYSSYDIYRSEDGISFSKVHTISSSFFSWTDLSPSEGVNYYRIGVDKGSLCTPTGNLKAGTGPYQHALSNMDDNKLKEGSDNQSPTSLALSDSTIDENLGVGSLVGRLSTEDPDTADNHIYKLVSGDGDTDNGRFTTVGDLLVSADVFDYETNDTLYVRIKSVDKGDLFVEQAFLVLVNDVTDVAGNNAPSDIILSNDSINENQAVGSLVGRLSTEDADTSDNHVYNLISGQGDTDNSRFAILGDMLITAEVFDFESRDSLYIRIKSSDKGDLSVEQQFLVLVKNVSDVAGNNAPTGMTLNNLSIDENQSVGSLVGRLSTEDLDASDYHTYIIVSGQGDKDNSRFSILGDMLITSEEFDFESRDSLYVRIKSTDKGDLSVEMEFLVLVKDVSEPGENLSPTGISLSVSNIDENQPVGTLVGRFQTDDPNPDDDHKYRLVDGSGGADNASFTLLNDLLISADIFDFETKTSYSIRVRSTDDGDGKLSFEKEFTITVVDLVETTALDDRLGTALLIYPNPFRDYAILRFPNPDHAKYLLRIRDVSGKTVRIIDNITEEEILISRNGMEKGLYLIELSGEKTYKSRIMVE